MADTEEFFYGRLISEDASGNTPSEAGELFLKSPDLRMGFFKYAEKNTDVKKAVKGVFETTYLLTNPSSQNIIDASTLEHFLQNGVSIGQDVRWFRVAVKNGLKLSAFDACPKERCLAGLLLARTPVVPPCFARLKPKELHEIWTECIANDNLEATTALLQECKKVPLKVIEGSIARLDPSMRSLLPLPSFSWSPRKARMGSAVPLIPCNRRKSPISGIAAYIAASEMPKIRKGICAGLVKSASTSTIQRLSLQTVKISSELLPEEHEAFEKVIAKQPRGNKVILLTHWATSQDLTKTNDSRALQAVQRIQQQFAPADKKELYPKCLEALAGVLGQVHNGSDKLLQDEVLKDFFTGIKPSAAREQILGSNIKISTAGLAELEKHVGVENALAKLEKPADEPNELDIF